MKLTTQRLLALGCLAGLGSCSVHGAEAAPPAAKRPETPSVLAALADADYPLDLTESGRVRLRDGVFQAPASPDSKAKLDVRLASQRAVGDVSADGKADAAVILNAEPGGSGSFSYLAVATQQGSTAKPVASVLLGDRIVVKSLEIRDGAVVVQMLTHGADDPLASPPTTPLTQRFVLRGQELMLLK